jgi:hypothetical protein
VLISESLGLCVGALATGLKTHAAAQPSPPRRGELRSEGSDNYFTKPFPEYR